MNTIPFPTPAPGARAKAAEVIKAKSYSRRKVTLASGRVSEFYLDMKPSMLDPEGSNLLAQLVFERVKDLEFDYIGGLEMGAVPLIAPISMISFIEHRPISGFFVRKERKAHGTMKVIEGDVPDDLSGKRVVILDDVTTTGGSAMEAVEAVQAAGATVVLVLSVVDREEGATEFYKNAGIPFDSLFSASDFWP
jgi:orotate phosphoribosyltransferase